MKFKVGDKVKCIGSSIGIADDKNMQYGGFGWLKDRIFTIYSINYNLLREQHCYWDINEENGVWENYLELVKKEIKIYGIAKFCKTYYK